MYIKNKWITREKVGPLKDKGANLFLDQRMSVRYQIDNLHLYSPRGITISWTWIQMPRWSWMTGKSLWGLRIHCSSLRSRKRWFWGIHSPRNWESNTSSWIHVHSYTQLAILYIEPVTSYYPWTLLYPGSVTGLWFWLPEINSPSLCSDTGERSCTEGCWLWNNYWKGQKKNSHSTFNNSIELFTPPKRINRALI